VGCTLLAWSVVAIAHAVRGLPPPSPQFKVMMLPGMGAGIFWSIGNIFATLAVVRGGNSVVIAQINAASLITSGLWGLIYYREIRGWPAVAWTCAAAFTAGMTILLSFEKGSNAPASPPPPPSAPPPSHWH
jgi:glucose uptake protein GlcU